MSFLELLTFPSSAYVIVPVYLGGLISKKRRLYIISLVIFFISTDLNILLKEFFQMPLDQRLNLTHTYAFPSGHIQNTAVLWGSLALCYKSYTGHAIFAICLVINSLAVYLLGFHTLLDILGAYYVTAVILLFCFQILPILWNQIKSHVCTDR